jgi:hypothetical protein
LTTIFSDMTMFLWLSKSSDSSCKIPNGSMTQNSTEHVIVMRTYSEVLDGIFQLFHVSRNAFVSTELIFCVLQPSFQSPKILLLLSPCFPGTQGTWSWFPTDSSGRGAWRC